MNQELPNVPVGFRKGSRIRDQPGKIPGTTAGGCCRHQGYDGTEYDTM